MESTAKKTDSKEKDIIINMIDIRQINRTSQDISSWRTAIKAAESVFSHNRTLLYDLYHDLLLDGHLWSAIDKRLTAVTNTPIFFGEDGVENEVIMELIESENFVEMVAEIINTKLWGYSVFELPFERGHFEAHLINRKHIIPERGEFKKHQSEIRGISYREDPYQNFVMEVGKKDDLGLLMKVAQYVIYKRGGFGDWAQFSELFGMPFRDIEYDGFDPKIRAELKVMLDEMGSAPYTIRPAGTKLEIIPNNSSGSNDTFDRLIEACNKEISKTIVGQTMTTEDGSSKSQSQTHMEVQKEIHFTDRLFVTRVLNQKLKPLLELHGYPVGKGKFSFVVDENIPKKDMIEIDMKVATQVPVPPDYWYETYGIDKPENFDELMAQKQAEKDLMKQLLTKQQPDNGNNPPQNSWWSRFFQ